MALGGPMGYDLIDGPGPGDDQVKAWASVDSAGEIVQVTAHLEVARSWFDRGARVRPLRWAGPAAQVRPRGRA